MKTIVFVRDATSPRIYNEIFALKQARKYRLVLVCGILDQFVLGLLNEVFDEIKCYHPPLLNLRQCGSSQIFKSSFISYLMKYLIDRQINSRIVRLSERTRLRSVIKQLKADMFVCPGGIYEPAAWIIENIKCPVVLDIHNGFVSKGLDNLSKKDHEISKYIFEHASGIIYRGSEFEIKYYRDHGYKINCPVFPYLDYCNRNFFATNDVKKLSSENNEYHLVNMGGGLSSHHIISLAKRLAKQKIHYHLYCVPHSITTPVMFKEFIKLNKTEKYFHLEKTLPFDKVPQEISKYDFGSLVFPSAYTDQLSQAYHKVNHGYRPFTFLEAGLPIIISDPLEYQKKTVEKYKVGFSVKEEGLGDLRNIIDKYDYEELKKNVFRAREKLLIDNHAEELIKFYDNVIERGIKG